MVIYVKQKVGVVMECSNCNSHSGVGSKFCNKCGTPFSTEQELPYVGVSKTRGIFRVTFAPQEREFNNEDAVADAVRHSYWNQDTEFKGVETIEFVRSTVTPETHPFECATCLNDEGNETVSESEGGRCENCGEVNWQRREVTPE